MKSKKWECATAGSDSLKLHHPRRTPCLVSLEVREGCNPHFVHLDAPRVREVMAWFQQWLDEQEDTRRADPDKPAPPSLEDRVLALEERMDGVARAIQEASPRQFFDALSVIASQRKE